MATAMWNAKWDAKEDRNASAELDSLIFKPSAATSLGVELEFQIIDPQTRDLAPGAVRILKVCEQEKLEGVTAELMQSMIEVKTGVCANVAEVKAQLYPRVRKLRNIASSLGYQLAMGATHPFNRGISGAVSPDARYGQIQDRLAWLTYQRVVFGQHVHVGMPSGDMALGVISMVIRYLPHLLAVTASSPFWHGEDTGLASSRSTLYGMLPHSGVPHYFRNWKEFRNFYRVMRDTNAIRSSKDIYWDIRPCPSLGTIEFRICDMPNTLSVALGVTALIQCLVVRAQRLIEERPHLVRGDVRRHWMAIENKWLATRHGLKAMHIRTPSGKRRLLSHDLNEQLDHLQPIAEEFGASPFLKAIRPNDKFETGAQRQRRLFLENGDWTELVDDMTASWAEEVKAGGPA